MGGAGRFRPGSASSNPAPAGSNPAPAASRWPPAEGPNTPHIALGNGRDEAGIRRVKQLGVTYVMGAGGVGPADGGHGQGPRQLPWQEADLRAGIARARENGLTLYNIMLENSFPNTIYGRPGRDEEIDKIRQTIRAAGKAGLPVIEYNWYAHRAMEGYFEETGRAGLGHTGFDYEKMRGLPPLEEDRIVVSADSDFGTILAAQEANRPSFILFRNPNLLVAADSLKMLLPVLPVLEPELVSGCVATPLPGKRAPVRHPDRGRFSNSLSRHGGPQRRPRSV